MATNKVKNLNGVENVSNLFAWTTNTDATKYRGISAYKSGKIIVVSFDVNIADTVSDRHIATVDNSILPIENMRTVMFETETRTVL